jgi:hypothetical protein
MHIPLKVNLDVSYTSSVVLLNPISYFLYLKAHSVVHTVQPPLTEILVSRQFKSVYKVTVMPVSGRTEKNHASRSG